MFISSLEIASSSLVSLILNISTGLFNNRTFNWSICFGVDAIFKCAHLKPLKLFKVWLIDVLFGNKFADSGVPQEIIQGEGFA